MTMNAPEASPLGKPTRYVDHYDPSLLFPIARAGKRAEIGIHGSLPFFGIDIWNAYEVSWLNARGKPCIALAHFEIPADSPNLIESKSFKLYLNSFNQTRLSGPDALRELLIRDIGTACGAPAAVTLSLPDAFAQVRFAEMSGVLLDRLDIEVDRYAPDPALLTVDDSQSPVEETLVSHLLKSNCLVTGQPDWGSIQIHYEGAPIDQEGLLRYLIGFRNHNKFHEQCVERAFVDILTHCQPQRLAVYARYTRRGGLDINPWRANFNTVLPGNLRHARQ